jgi:hypothetical protein
MHHSNLTAADLEATMALRADWVAAGRPSDHEYMRRIADVQWDGPAALVRRSATTYTLREVR